MRYLPLLAQTHAYQWFQPPDQLVCAAQVGFQFQIFLGKREREASSWVKYVDRTSTGVDPAMIAC
jgi:hypothetical protein